MSDAKENGKQNMKKTYFAPVFGPRHELIRHAGVVVDATRPEDMCRRPKNKNDKLKPLGTGRHAAFLAIKATLDRGERVLERHVRSLG